MEKDHIILTILVLTSRKEEQVRRCLESLEPLRREVSCELVAVDTSEDPHMREVLTEYTDHIVPFHWIQDFSAARNAGLREARGEWLLYLDDDEWFVELQEIIDFFKKGTYRKYNGATYIQRNFSNLSGTVWDDNWVSRMAKLRPKTRFRSPIHEYFDPAPDKSIGLRSIVNHYGYVFTTKEQKIAHYERNRGLIQRMIDEEPDNVRWWMQMMLEYSSVDKHQELLELGDACIEHFKESKAPEVINAYSSFYASKVVAYDGMRKYKEADRVCKEALEDSRTSRLGQAFFHTFRGKYALEREKYQKAEREELRYLEANDYFKEYEAQAIIQGGVPFVMQTFSEVYLRRAYSILICAGLKQGNPSYLKKYFSKLQLDENAAYLFPILPTVVVEGMAEIDAEKLFVKTLRSLARNEDVWQKFELALLDYVMEDRKGSDQLVRLLELAGIEAGFMKLYPLRRRLSEDSGELSDEELVRLLEDYAQLGSSYYENQYTEEDRESNSPKLPADYRAALLLKKLFEETPEKRLSMLKDVVEAYPPFSEVIKRYAAILGEQMKSAAPPKKLNRQMEQMAKQVMDNVQVLLDSGLIAEAYGVIRQLHEMLPDNEQVRKLEREIRMRLQ